MGAVLVSWLIAAVVPARGDAGAAGQEAAAAMAPGSQVETRVIHSTWWSLRIPQDAKNLALKNAGATATASSTADGFSPEGVLDGVWTAEDWGKGHGWQSARKHEFPCWLEIRLPREEEVDTIVIQTFPPWREG